MFNTFYILHRDTVNVILPVVDKKARVRKVSFPEPLPAIQIPIHIQTSQTDTGPIISARIVIT